MSLGLWYVSNPVRIESHPMKQNISKSRELFYLSLLLAGTLFIITLDLSIHNNEKILQILNNYLWFEHLDLVFKIVFLYSIVLIGLLYRRWQLSLTKQLSLEDIISSINPDALLVVDSQDNITMCNSSITRMLGYASDEVINQHTNQFIMDMPAPENTADTSLDNIQKDGFNMKSAIGKKKNGQEVPLEIILGNLGIHKGKVLLLRDISERKKTDQALRELTEKLKLSNEELTRLVNIDPLTDILNRRGFEDVLTKEIHRAKREDSSLAAILLDCDNFKHINDTMGHAVGDVVLKEIAQRLKNSLRASDQIARIGGDEFLVLLPNTRWAEAISVAEKLRLSVSASLLISGNKPVNITASLGVTLLSYETSSIEEILALTRIPLHRSKQLGKNIISTTKEWSRTDKTKSTILSHIKGSLLQDDCLYATSQAIVQLNNNQLVGYELLIRSTIDIIKNPNDFLLFSLEHNILTHVDLRCLKTCIAATADLEQNLKYHINLFPSTMLATPLERLLDAFPFGPDREKFSIEISEQQFIGDLAYLQKYTAGLKKAGIKIAIDDLGFGRSSLESLIILEPDIIKIDRKYVSGIATDAGKRRSLRRLMTIVENLDAEIIAEGVETTEELDILIDMGILYGQGYLWGKPSKIQDTTKTASLALLPSDIKTLSPSG